MVLEEKQRSLLGNNSVCSKRMLREREREREERWRRRTNGGEGFEKSMSKQFITERFTKEPSA